MLSRTVRMSITITLCTTITSHETKVTGALIWSRAVSMNTTFIAYWNAGVTVFLVPESYISRIRSMVVETRNWIIGLSQLPITTETSMSIIQINTVLWLRVTFMMPIQTLILLGTNQIVPIGSRTFFGICRHGAPRNTTSFTIPSFSGTPTEIQYSRKLKHLQLFSWNLKKTIRDFHTRNSEPRDKLSKRYVLSRVLDNWSTVPEELGRIPLQSIW